MLRFLLCVLAFVFANSAVAKPSRLVSLDYCADQFVLALADRDDIAAVSRGARRDDSYFRDRARGVRQTRGTLEEVLALRPDLVVRNWGGPWDAEAVYARFEVPVLQVGDAPNFVVAREDMLDAARAIGHPERGESIARDLDLRLARLRARAPAAPPAVLYLSAGGAVAGSNTMMHAVIEAAGAQNAHRGQSWTVLPLERLVELPPALIALGFFHHGRQRVNPWLPGRHPVVRRSLARSETVTLPTPSIACEAWFAIDAAETLAAALRP